MVLRAMHCVFSLFFPALTEASFLVGLPGISCLKLRSCLRGCAKACKTRFGTSSLASVLVSIAEGAEEETSEVAS